MFSALSLSRNFQAFRELTVIAAFGLPISYAVAFVWMAPIIYLLHRLCWLRAATLVVAGALGGMIVGLGFYFAQRYTLFKVIMPLPAATLLGALAGGAIWWAAQGKGAANGSAT